MLVVLVISHLVFAINCPPTLAIGHRPPTTSDQPLVHAICTEQIQRRWPSATTTKGLRAAVGREHSFCGFLCIRSWTFQSKYIGVLEGSLNCRAELISHRDGFFDSRAPFCDPIKESLSQIVFFLIFLSVLASSNGCVQGLRDSRLVVLVVLVFHQSSPLF